MTSICAIVYFVLENMSYHELLKIDLDKTPPVYVPGETINGKVILNPTATITIRGKKCLSQFWIRKYECICMCVW